MQTFFWLSCFNGTKDGLFDLFHNDGDVANEMMIFAVDFI